MGKRGLVASVLITALVMVLMIAVLFTAVLGVVLIVSSDTSTDGWDDLGSVVFAMVIGVLVLPVFATLLLHILKVPRAVLIMVASAVTIGVDLGATRLVYNDDSQPWALGCVVLIPAAWALVLHPSVLRVGAGDPARQSG